MARASLRSNISASEARRLAPERLRRGLDTSPGIGMIRLHDKIPVAGAASL